MSSDFSDGQTEQGDPPLNPKPSCSLKKHRIDSLFRPAAIPFRLAEYILLFPMVLHAEYVEDLRTKGVHTQSEHIVPLK